MKTCTACGRKRRLSSYHRDAKALDGRVGRCKDCVREATAAWARKNRARKNATDRKWHKSHPDKTCAQSSARAHISRRTHCELCWRRCRTERHHPDYNNPLYVQHLCKRCHARQHAWGQVSAAVQAFTSAIIKAVSA